MSVRSVSSSKKRLSSQSLRSLSTVYGKNSPFKEQWERSEAGSTTASEAARKKSAYEEAADSEEAFDIPPPGSINRTALEVLAPLTLEKKLQEQAAKEAATGTRKSQPTKKDKKIPDPSTVRKSARLADKATEVPKAPSKRKAVSIISGDTNPEDEEAGVQVIITDLKDLRDEVLKYLDHLDSERRFGERIEHIDLEVLTETAEEVRDYRRKCKAQLDGLADVCEPEVYHSVYDEFAQTLGARLQDWAFKIKEWIDKKKDPNAPTPERTIIGPTPSIVTGKQWWKRGHW